LVTFGLAWPLASRLKLDPSERLSVAAVLSLVAVYLVAFVVYILRMPVAVFWVLPALGLTGLAAGRHALVAALSDVSARALLIGQALIVGWCVGWLALVVSYSGGGWVGDWIEHFDRAQFFLRHWPIDTEFLGIYPLSARPPLANLVTGALLGPIGATFAGYQLVTTLLSCLAFLPAALLARRFQPGPRLEGGPQTAIAVCAVLLMLNPSFVENTTFAWTKLIEVFFFLNGLYFFLRAHDEGGPSAAGPLCAASLGAAALAHYSAGPYIVMLAGAWFALGRTRWRDPAFWRRTALLGLIGGSILCTWLGWSSANYGIRATLFSNTSVAVPEYVHSHRLLVFALNLRDTVVPQLPRFMFSEITSQSSPWGYWRDWFFLLYQQNLLLAFGAVGWLVLARELVRSARSASRRSLWFWTFFSGGTILLSVLAGGERGTWGCANVCLQGIALLGRAFLASRWATLGRGWQLAWVAGACFDLCFGIGLQFGIQSFALDRWLAPGTSFADKALSYSAFAMMNLRAKMQRQFVFFADAIPANNVLLLALLAAILTLAVLRVGRSRQDAR
jgi:hypothetical protein